MGSTMADRLRATRARAFVGRARELALFDSLLRGAAPSRHLLWLSGPGGIGKSTLLERLADAALAAGRPVVRVNAAVLPPTAEAFREAVARQFAAAADPVGAVMFVDGLEHLAHLEEWLRTDLLPGLPDDTLTVVASRHPPDQRWRADLGWADELVVAAITGFDAEEVAAYLAVRGMDPAVGEAILTQTQGHPLALALVSDLLARGGATDPEQLRVAGRPDLVRALLERFVDEVPDPGGRRALHVLGQARTTTVALLRSVLGPDDAEESFAWLSGLSFAERREDGVAPHELARVVLAEDLRWRDPEASAALSDAIRAHSKQRLLASTGPDQQRAADDLLWYHRRSPALAAHLTGTEGVRLWVDQATEADLPAVLDLIGRHEGPASVATHRAWWQGQPEAFLVARSAADPVHGFLLHLRLDRPPTGADPVAAAAWDLVARLAPLRPGEHLRVIRSWVGRDGYHQPTATNQAFAEGRPTCSYKGGDPGFVRVLDPQTVAFPNYDGNAMYLSAGNVLVNPHVGMLFIDFERGHRMRLEGEAAIDLDDPLAAEFPVAQFVVRVRARAVYPNCPRYIHRYQLVRRSRFVPREDCPTPVPAWKRSDWAFDALPGDDPARDPGEREVLGR